MANMAYPKVRVFYAEQNSGPNVLDLERARPDTVTVPLGEILPMLEEAVRNRRGWLYDFEDDAVTLSNDLYEVLLASRRYWRHAA